MNIEETPYKRWLEIVVRHDFAGSYEFDEVIIFRDQAGQLLAGHDSGCSCPIPWENMGVPDLTPVRGFHEILDYARSSVSQYNYDAATWASVVEAALKGVAE